MAAAEALASIGPKAAPAVPALVAAAGVPDENVQRPARVRGGARRDRAGREGGAAGAPADRGPEPISNVGGVIDRSPSYAAEQAIRQIEGK